MYKDIIKVSVNVKNIMKIDGYYHLSFIFSNNIFSKTFKSNVNINILDLNNINEHLNNNIGFFVIDNNFYNLIDNIDIKNNECYFNSIDKILKIPIISYENIYYCFNDFDDLNINDNYFSFGENWINYASQINNEVLEINNKYIFNLMAENNINIENKIILDLGCGSGINSVSLSFLNPKKIVCIDYDNNSVECTKRIINTYGNKNVEYECIQTSILDDNFISKYLETFDFIYCYGVLHHTGNMYQAINNTFKLSKQNCKLYLGLYHQFNTLERDLENKTEYFYGNKSIKNYLICDYMAVFKNWHVKKIDDLQNYSWNIINHRGMNRYHDCVDWLGGFPYEVINVNILNNICIKSNISLINHIEKIEAVNTYILMKN